MGQKVHPVGLRLGINRTWLSRWYAGAEFREYLLEDARIRDFLKKRAGNSAISRVEIERAANRVTVIIHTAKPGIIIGRGGSGVDRLRNELEDLVGKDVHINVKEVSEPEKDAQLVAEAVAQQISRRVSFRRAMRQAVQRTMRAGARGVKVMCSGRLGGHEMARTETMMDGSIPLHTLRAYIDYGFTEAATTYGNIGVKVWIYTHDVLGEGEGTAAEEKPEPQRRMRERISSRERATVTVTREDAQRLQSDQGTAPETPAEDASQASQAEEEQTNADASTN